MVRILLIPDVVTSASDKLLILRFVGVSALRLDFGLGRRCNDGVFEFRALNSVL